MFLLNFNFYFISLWLSMMISSTKNKKKSPHRVDQKSVRIIMRESGLIVAREFDVNFIHKYQFSIYIKMRRKWDGAVLIMSQCLLLNLIELTRVRSLVSKAFRDTRSRATLPLNHNKKMQRCKFWSFSKVIGVNLLLIKLIVQSFSCWTQSWVDA